MSFTALCKAALHHASDVKLHSTRKSTAASFLVGASNSGDTVLTIAASLFAFSRSSAVAREQVDVTLSADKLAWCVLLALTSAVRLRALVSALLLALRRPVPSDLIVDSQERSSQLLVEAATCACWCSALLSEFMCRVAAGLYVDR